MRNPFRSYAPVMAKRSSSNWLNLMASATECISPLILIKNSWTVVEKNANELWSCEYWQFLVIKSGCVKHIPSFGLGSSSVDIWTKEVIGGTEREEFVLRLDLVFVCYHGRAAHTQERYGRWIWWSAKGPSKKKLQEVEKEKNKKAIMKVYVWRALCITKHLGERTPKTGHDAFKALVSICSRSSGNSHDMTRTKNTKSSWASCAHFYFLLITLSVCLLFCASLLPHPLDPLLCSSNTCSAWS